MDTTLAAVVLDVDGTLVDSERDGHRVAFNRAFEEFGLPYSWDVAPYGRLLAVTGGQRRLHGFLTAREVPEEDRRELVARLHHRRTELFKELVAQGRVPARPGAAELLEGRRVEDRSTMRLGGRRQLPPSLPSAMEGRPDSLFVKGADDWRYGW